LSWIYKLENRIYTIVKTRTTKVLSKYPDLNFTQDPEPDDTTPHFPTVFFTFLPSAEMGRTIEGSSINAIMSTIEVQVTSSKTQGLTVARTVSWEVVEQLKALRYEVVLSPKVIPTGNDTCEVVFRMRRMIGANDKIG